MTNIAAFDLHATGRPGTNHPHRQQLIMHWIDACTDPKAHRVATATSIAASPITHHDQLVAVWMEQTSVLPQAVGLTSNAKF